MGGHGGLNILPQKKWNVYRKDNQEKVEKDRELLEKGRQMHHAETLKDSLIGKRQYHETKTDQELYQMAKKKEKISGDKQVLDSSDNFGKIVEHKPWYLKASITSMVEDK